MKPKKLRYGLGWLLTGLFVLGLASCDFSYFEIDELPDYQYSPVFAIPLVNSTLTISDFVPDEDEDLIEVGDDQLISLVYSAHLGVNWVFGYRPKKEEVVPSIVW